MSDATALAAAGYVRMPRQWIALPVSPAARLLLLHFCGAADADGASWYSYRQLSEIIARSKSAISGYVNELRAAGVIETETQRTANGFNSRLKIRLVGWRAILAAWTARATGPRGDKTTADPAAAQSGSRRSGPPDRQRHPTRRSVECRVQPAERKDPSGPNKPYSTDSSGGDAQGATGARVDQDVWSDVDEKAWCDVRPSETDPIGVFDKTPSDKLLQKAVNAADVAKRHAGFLEGEARRRAAAEVLRNFMKRRRLEPPSAGLEAAANALAAKVATARGLRLVLAALEAEWAPHWRRLSTPAQLEEMAERILAADRDYRPTLAFVGRLMRRAFIARMELKMRMAGVAASVAAHSCDRRTNDRQPVDQRLQVWHPAKRNMLDCAEALADKGAWRSRVTSPSGGSTEQLPS